MAPAPMKVAELLEHPEYAHVTWKLPPRQKGTVSVAGQRRGGAVDIAYEIHGHGPVKIAWIMGMGSLKTAWQRQTKDFGHERAAEYSCLLLDNRGVGESGKPLMRYSSSEMARDVLEVLDAPEVGWTAARSVHVCGVSLGGMIAQELALLAPERVASLTLLSTAARLVNTVGYWENLRNRLAIFLPKAEDVQIEEIKHRLFSDDWLEAPDEIGGGFPTNGDRIAATELAKRRDAAQFTPRSLMLQAVAALWHHKSDAQLAQIGDAVGRQRIQVMHGTVDELIAFPHCAYLVDGLGGEAGGVTKVVFEGVGHVIPIQRRKEFFELMSNFIDKTRKI